jgi:post-segregation antitoxin (ccd killing protein)
MDIDKSVNQAPLGLSEEDMMGQEPDIEIVIEDPDHIGSEDEAESDAEAEDEEFSSNLAENMDEGQLTELAGDLLGEFEEDISSRKDWMQTYVDGLELLGMKVEDRTEPWPGACGVYHPLLSEALVKFQAETMMETFPARGPVRTEIVGKETPAKKEAAQRVEADMNYQLTDVMIEYRPEHERMLWGLGLSGNAFKKVYYDPSLGRQTSMYVPSEDVVVPYGASSLEVAGRVTHVMRKTPNEVAKLQAAGFYRDIELEDPVDSLDEVETAIAERMGFRASTDDRYKLLEMQVELELEDDEFRDEEDEGIALPYIVTIEKGTQTVLSVRRNWDPDDKKKLKRQHFVHYPYVPGFGFYAFGLIHLIGAFAKSGTSLIRQLVDAGTLSNLPGGFKTKGLRVKGDDTPIAPAEWRDVDVASGTMRDNIMPLPYKEPSQVLYSLLGTIVEEGRRFAGAADMKISDMSGQAPVGTTLAILERTLKSMSAIQARVHYSMKQEFRLLKDIIRDYTPVAYSYDPVEGSRKAKQADYDMVAVIPVSDPNAATMAQKIVQYQAVLQLAQTAPQIYDMPYLHRQMLDVLGITNANKLVPLKDGDDMKPRDPISENMDVINGKPVKAFIYQDHEAHIAVHTGMMQDPQVAAMIGQNPQGQTVMAAMQAHMQEHLAFSYRKQIEEQAGVALPPPDAEMSEDIELQVSRLAAAAAQQLTQKKQAEAQQQQNQEAAQDPLVQMQMKELEIKQGELDLKKQKLQVDAAEKNDRLELEQNRIEAQKEIAGLQVGAKLATAKGNLDAKQEADGLRMGVDIAREELQMNQQQKEATPASPTTKEVTNE